MMRARRTDREIFGTNACQQHGLTTHLTAKHLAVTDAFRGDPLAQVQTTTFIEILPHQALHLMHLVHLSHVEDTTAVYGPRPALSAVQVTR